MWRSSNSTSSDTTKKEDCDALRFHWFQREDSNQVGVLQFSLQDLCLAQCNPPLY